MFNVMKDNDYTESEFLVAPTISQHSNIRMHKILLGWESGNVLVNIITFIFMNDDDYMATGS